jgi:hypothetical protein
MSRSREDEKFLNEYRDLCLKHGMFIDGWPLNLWHRAELDGAVGPMTDGAWAEEVDDTIAEVGLCL